MFWVFLGFGELLRAAHRDLHISLCTPFPITNLGRSSASFGSCQILLVGFLPLARPFGAGMVLAKCKVERLRWSTTHKPFFQDNVDVDHRLHLGSSIERELSVYLQLKLMLKLSMCVAQGQ